MTAPNHFTAAQLDELHRKCELDTGRLGPGQFDRLLTQARRAIELEARVAELEEDLSAATLFARALVAKIDRDGGQAQRGESLQYSCHRATGAVIEALAELDRIHSGKRLSIEELNTLWLANGRNVESFALAVENHYRARCESRIAELETQLAEREGLERRRDALLRKHRATELHDATSMGLDRCHTVWFRFPGQPEGRSDEGCYLDYWQALRAALDDAEKGSAP